MKNEDMGRGLAMAALAGTALPADDVELMKNYLNDMDREFGQRDGWLDGLPGLARFGMASVFFTACAMGAPRCAIEMIERGMPFDGPVSNDGTERTPLIWAARNDNVDLASRVLELGANVEKGDGESLRPLMSAARTGSKEVLHLLLRAGAKIDAADDFGQTALAHAIKGGSVACVVALLDAGADPDAGMAGGAHHLSQDAEERERTLDCCAALNSWLERRDLQERVSAGKARSPGPSRM